MANKVGKSAKTKKIREPAYYVAKNPRGAKKRYDVCDIEELWEEYKHKCDTNVVTETKYDPMTHETINVEILRPISYTIKGFCAYLYITYSAWQASYANDIFYEDIVDKIKLECEADVRAKFETRQIPTGLAALWMSKYGYAAKNEQEISGGGVPVVIKGEEDLSD